MFTIVRLGEDDMVRAGRLRGQGGSEEVLVVWPSFCWNACPEDEPNLESQAGTDGGKESGPDVPGLCFIGIVWGSGNVAFLYLALRTLDRDG